MTVNESLDKTQKRLLDFFFPRKCPFCCSEIAKEATRCPHCTSELPKYKAA